MQPKFKVGDRLVVRTRENHSGLIKGHIYTIFSYCGGSVKLKNQGVTLYKEHYFELAPATINITGKTNSSNNRSNNKLKYTFNSSPVVIDWKLLNKELTYKNPIVTVQIGDSREVTVLIHSGIIDKAYKIGKLPITIPTSGEVYSWEEVGKIIEWVKKIKKAKWINEEDKPVPVKVEVLTI